MTAMRVGEFYRPELTAGRWDAVVVGSGIRGLAVAARLARAGRRQSIERGRKLRATP